ncbi:hypothetical protein [Kribbella sp. NPDC055071]
MNNQLPEPEPSRLEVTLFGPVAAAVLVLLDERYNQVSTSTAREADTVVTIGDVDQAGERAVLTLLWDTGHRIRSVHRSAP